MSIPDLPEYTIDEDSSTPGTVVITSLPLASLVIVVVPPLLALLASKPGNVFERDVIMDQVWGSEIIVGDRTIDVHIRKLREKLGRNYIETVKGVGYKFKLNE